MIIATNINQLTMSSAFDTLTTNKGTVELYLKELMNRPVNSKDVYVDFTQICYLYDKKAIHYLRLDETKELIEIAKEVDNITIPLIKTIRGRKGKTFIHYVILLDALRWIDKRLAYEMDKILRQVFKQADIVKRDRSETIREFHPLTKAIEDYFLPHINNKIGRKMIYPTVMDFANKQVINMTAKQFREMKAKEGIIVHKDETRCYFDDDVLSKVIAIEKKFYDLIINLELENFQQLKAIYLKRVSVKKIWNYSKDELKALNAKLDIYEKRVLEYNATGKDTVKILAKIEEIKSKYH